MKKLPQIFAMALLATSVLSACSDNGKPDRPDYNPLGPTSTVGGTAVKGIIKNGIVKVYGVTNGVAGTTPLVEGVTGTDGTYSLVVPDYSGPVVVEITAGATTSMVCDVIGGCGAIAYGADVTLTSDFNLKAIVPDVKGGPVTTNVTALTSMAASLAQSNGNINATSAANANSQVAALFNITGELTKLPVVDVTNPASVAAASKEAQEAAILNSALLSAALSDGGSGATVASVLAKVLSDFATNNGQVIQNESTDGETVSLEEILAAAIVIISDPSLADVDLGTLKSTTELLLDRAKNAPADTPTTVEPTDPAATDKAQAAKDMVAAVRKFTLDATYDDSAETSFSDSVDMALDLVSDDDVDTVLDSLEEISEIISTAYEANMEAKDAGQALVSYNYSIMDENDGSVLMVVPVTITSSDGVDTYAIDATIPTTVTNSVALDIDVAAMVSENETTESTETETTEAEDYALAVSLKLSGTIASENVAMTIDAGDIDVALTSEWMFSQATSTTEEMDVEMLNVELASLDLDITLAQLTGTAPISFTGGLTFDIVDLTETDEEVITPCDIADGPTGTDTCYGQTIEEKSTFTVDEVSFMLSGTFTKGADSVTQSITIDIDPDTSIHSEHTTSIESWVSFFQSGQWLGNDSNYESTSELIGDTDENLIGVNFGIGLIFDLAGNSDTTGIMLTASRTGTDSANASIDIAIGADRLDIDFDINNDDVNTTITDQNGNTITLAETCDANEECTLSGMIHIDDEAVATITEDDGVLVVEYSDGSFEVL